MHSASSEQNGADAQAAPGSSGQEQYGRRTIIITLLGALLVTFIATLDGTVVGPAFPHIVADLQGFNLFVWVETVYLLTSTITLPIYGRISDRVGRKPILLFCLLVFLLASALCGLAQSMIQLVIFRAVQGIGAGGLEIMASAIIADIFPPRERGKWQGLWGSVYALAAIMGPLIGGALTDALSWRWVFYVNVPIGIAALIVLGALMPSLGSRDKHASLDYVGIALFMLGSLLLLLAFSWAGSQFAWLSPQIIGLLVGALVALTLLLIYCARQERRGREPIIEPSLFRASVRIFDVALLVTTVAYIALVGSSYFIPFFIQCIVGASATESGLILIPTMLTAIVGSMAAGALISSTGRYKWIALTGTVLSIIGTILLVRLNTTSSYLDVILGTVIQGLGIGVGMSVYTIAVQNALPRKIGQVTSIMMYSRQIGQSIGLALMGSVVSASYIPSFAQALAKQHSSPVPAQLSRSFNDPLVLLSSPDVLAHLREQFTQFSPQGQTLFNTLFNAAKTGLTESIHTAFVLSVIIIVPTFLVVCFLKEMPLRGRKQQAQASTQMQEAFSYE